MMPQLLPYLQLCRLPTVFTAMADIFLGYLLVSQGLSTPDGDPVEFLQLLAASSCLYLSGMVWNDVADRDVDARERPTRPIPSGRVKLSQATAFGAGLMAIGLISAAFVSLLSGAVALILAALIIGYDFVFKKSVLGPVTMGACRFHNVLLGASAAAENLREVYSQPQIWVATGLGIYIAGVTWFARTEARRSSRTQLAAAMMTVNLGLVTLVGWIANSDGTSRLAVVLVMTVIILTINRRLVAAIAEPIPERVQPSIRTMLLSIIMIDATLIAHRLGPAGSAYALLTVALLIPAMTLGRWIRMT